MSQSQTERASTATVAVDGRTARGQRTREAVVEAVIALLNEGDVRPTAARVAERAGVSLRSVFQHFTDLEDLFATVADRQLTMFQGLPALPEPEAPLSARIDAFVARRAVVLERITPVRRAAALQSPFSAVVRERLERVRRAAQHEIERVFAAELAAQEPARRAALAASLHACASWSTWENLRAEQGLGFESARDCLLLLLSSLLRAPSAA